MSYVIVGGICLFIGAFIGIAMMCLVAINRSEEDRRNESK